MMPQKVAPPVVESTTPTPVPEFYHDGNLYKLGCKFSKGQDEQEPEEVIFENQNDRLIGGDKYMGDSQALQFRGLVAIVNYLSQDRPDIQYSIKEMARRMARPRVSDWALVKRVARYLVGVRKAVLAFYWQEVQKTLMFS